MWDPHEPFDCPWYDYELYGDPGYEGDKFLYPEYGRPIYMTEEERNHLRALYAGNVTLTDRWLGMFFDMAERLGLFRDTMIIWVSDHGHLLEVTIFKGRREPSWVGCMKELLGYRF